ncbi:hypothetical protein BSF42_00170 [Flavobacterium sp. ACN6]|nr:hypothetical protein BSF42_00170 [Flavobacterium sp. ACN6]
MTLFVSALSFTSCSSDSGSEDTESSKEDYWPTAVGNQWVLNQNGSETSMKIISSEKVKEDTYYKFDKLFITSSSPVSGTASAYLKKVNGDYYVKLDEFKIIANGFSGTMSGYEFIFFKDYLEANKTWTGTYLQETTYTGIGTIKMTTKYTGTIVEKGATVTVKGNIYTDVIRFKLKLETSMEGQSAGAAEVEYWIAKGVGVIKFVMDDMSSELVSYKLN